MHVNYISMSVSILRQSINKGLFFHKSLFGYTRHSPPGTATFALACFTLVIQVSIVFPFESTMGLSIVCTFVANRAFEQYFKLQF